ncbi:MAG: sigma-70 family RNA polymerase sigma factor [Chloroflexi bacterium]|nr:sigma-70 family RNA polymerase sigma factor [Chloroflexota bacterium]
MYDEAGFVEALRQGDEAAFAALFDRYHTALVRTALIYVSHPSAADEVAQETWLAVFKGVGRFEGRSSLKTWIFSILVNRAKTYAQREGRYVPLDWDDANSDEPTVAPSRFAPDEHTGAPRHWINPPGSWESIPEDRLLSRELRGCIQQAINALPANQRLVITLRDVEGLSSDEVCNILAVSETNQRVLLHRARARVRQAVENYLSE